MNNPDAGPKAGSECTPIANHQPSTAPISPAARKFAEYLARRMVPMIESATKRSEEPQQANDAVVFLTQRKRG
jgi:hypothetical protein